MRASMKEDLSALCWPLSQLGTGLEALARRSGLGPAAVQVPSPPVSLSSETGREALGRWIDSATAWLGVEAEPSTVSYQGLERMVESAGPAVLELPGMGTSRFLLLLPRRRRGRVSMLAPDLRTAHLSTEVVRNALCVELEKPVTREADQLLEEAGITGARREAARTALVRDRLRAKEVGGCWLLRQSPGANFWSQAKRMRLHRGVALLLAAHGVEYFLLIFSWWLIGKAALAGHLDYGWLLAWALLLLTLVPFRWLGTWLQGWLAIHGGILFKQRLLLGALRLYPEEVRHKGVGRFLGEVIESGAVESLALSVGFQGLTAAIELLAAEIVLSQGVGAIFELFLLPLWVAATLLVGRHYFKQRKQWTRERLAITNDLTERMVGHRTRLAQEAQEHWHQGEDEALERYLDYSAKMDRTAARLVVMAPRGWLVVGLLGITGPFVFSRSSDIGLAIALGGILVAYRALKRLADGALALADAVISWEQVAQLFHAAARPQLRGSPAINSAPAAPAAEEAAPSVLDAHELIFRYADRGEPVLRGCSLAVHRGDRILLQGSSGGGKSTLASLLIGLRAPQSGLVLLDGLDRQTLGDQGWRRRIVSAPQFHENHVLTETFAFNLLMGRQWPPREEDMREAETICRELGLGPLLAKMPAGMVQMVGETGWRLSHGERSRLYIARALLQRADMVVFDESFAALDPENVRLALDCVLRRASTVFVIAHP
jgi:ATP-binding cassette, subfamily B, bacterial